MDSSPFHRRVIAGFAWQGISKIAIQAISWVSTIVVARLLDPADYGIVAVATVFITILNLIMEMGLAQGLIQKTTITREEEDGVFWFGLALGSALYGLLYLAAPAVAEFYAMPVLGDVLRVSGLILIIGSLKTVPVALTMRKLDFRFRATREISASLISTLSVVAMALGGAGVWSLVLGALIHNIVLVAGYLPVLGRLPQPTANMRRIGGILRYGSHITVGNVAYAVSSGADVFLIGKYLGSQVTGYYSMAFLLATMPLDKIGTIFNHVGFSALSRTKDDNAQCRSLFMELHRQLIFVTYPLLIGIALVAEDAVAVVLTEKWLPIVPAMQILCIVGALRVSGMLIPPLLNSRGKAHWSLRYSVSGMVLLPAAFFVGVNFGLIGVAIAWLAAYPLLYAMLLRFMRKDMGIRLSDLIAGARETLIAASGMALAVLAVQHYGADQGHGVRLAAGAIVGVAVYTGIYFVFFDEQIARMRHALKTLRSRA